VNILQLLVSFRNKKRIVLNTHTSNILMHVLLPTGHQQTSIVARLVWRTVAGLVCLSVGSGSTSIGHGGPLAEEEMTRMRPYSRGVVKYGQLGVVQESTYSGETSIENSE
jgi:hypothetical protein